VEPLPLLLLPLRLPRPFSTSSSCHPSSHDAALRGGGALLCACALGPAQSCEVMLFGVEACRCPNEFRHLLLLLFFLCSSSLLLPFLPPPPPPPPSSSSSFFFLLPLTFSSPSSSSSFFSPLLPPLLFSVSLPPLLFFSSPLPPPLLLGGEREKKACQGRRSLRDKIRYDKIVGFQIDR
jgi:hypothetical protein